MSVASYLKRMTPENVWPAAHDPAEVIRAFDEDLEDTECIVLTWKSNGRQPMDDMLAAWVVLGKITQDQADATSDARATATAAELSAYRANPPQLSDEDLFEMRAAFGPGEVVVDVLRGQRFTL